MFKPETTPRSEGIMQTKTDDFFLTHSLWHNGYGACPETGVRSVIAGKVQDDFRLIQHNVRDFVFAEHYILKALRKGWSPSRVCDFVEHLFERKRPRAVTL